MWKLFAGLSLILCTFVGAHEPHIAKPPQASVTVECRGRLRHGVVAIGGETTGTTITFNRIVYELELKEEADREFAKKHHKEPVIATGTLRKIQGTESKVRWIIDVQTLSKRDATKEDEGVLLTVQGTLRSTPSAQGDSPVFTMEAADHVWPIDLSTNTKLQAQAKLLLGQLVFLTGSLEQETEDESPSPAVIRVKTLAQPATATGKE